MSKLSSNITCLHLPKATASLDLPELVKAPWGRRLGAYGVDWFTGDLFAAFPVAIIYSIVTGRTEVTGKIAEVPGGFVFLAGVLCLCFIFLYYVFIPWKVWNGQTIGKRLLGIRMAGRDGSRLTLPRLLLRQVVCLLILENGLLTAGHYIGEIVLLAGGSALFVRWWANAGLAARIISGLLVVFTPLGRGLHDYGAGTRVVLARGR